MDWKRKLANPLILVILIGVIFIVGIYGWVFLQEGRPPPPYDIDDISTYSSRYTPEQIAGFMIEDEVDLLFLQGIGRYHSLSDIADIFERVHAHYSEHGFEDIEYAFVMWTWAFCVPNGREYSVFWAARLLEQYDDFIALYENDESFSEADWDNFYEIFAALEDGYDWDLENDRKGCELWLNGQQLVLR